MSFPTIRNRLRRLEQLPIWRPPQEDSAWSPEELELIESDQAARALKAQGEQVMLDAYEAQPELREYRNDRERLLRGMSTPMLIRLHDVIESLQSRLNVLRGQSVPTNQRNPEAVHGTS